MSDNTKIFHVNESDVGVRLDKFVAGQLPEFSRSEIQKFNIHDAKNSTRKIKLSDKVKVDEAYAVTLPEKKTTDILQIPKRRDCALDILFEDDDIIVLNKPRGVAMYPGAGIDTGTLVQSVLAHTDLSALGGAMRPGVVHRLDKDTSGVVIFAKSDAAMRALTRTFAAHDLVRKYIAFVWGVPNWTTADITGNIGRGKRNRQKMTMLTIGGKSAKTTAEVIHAWPRENISEMRCTLYTGRTHQIRVHLSAHGFPVLCDPLYGRGNGRLGSIKNPELLEFVRTHHGQMLHAEILELNHPITSAPLKFRAKWPDDMRELKEILA